MEVKKCLDNLTFLIDAEEKKTPSYFQMKLIVNYTQSPHILLCILLFLTFRFLFGNRLKNIPNRAFYHVYTDRPIAEDEFGDLIMEQIM